MNFDFKMFILRIISYDKLRYVFDSQRPEKLIVIGLETRSSHSSDSSLDDSNPNDLSSDSNLAAR